MHMSCRDLIILEAKVWLLRNGRCEILMTGIVERSLNLIVYNLVLELYVRGGKFANHVFLFCRNRLLLCILTISKDVLGRLPKVVGIDVVELALWAKVHGFL